MLVKSVKIVQDSGLSLIIHAMELLGTNSINLAVESINGTPFGSGDNPPGGYLPYRAFNNTLTGYNIFYSTTSGAYLGYNFNNMQDITLMRLYETNYYSHRLQNGKILISRNTTNGVDGDWVIISEGVSMGASGQWHEFPFPIITRNLTPVILSTMPTALTRGFR